MADAPTEQEQKDRDNALSRAYGRATSKLRQAHRDEFNDLYQEAAQAEGVEWTPRMTEEQKAEQAFDELLEKFPHLRERLNRQDQDEAEDDEDQSDEAEDAEGEQPDEGEQADGEASEEEQAG